MGLREVVHVDRRHGRGGCEADHAATVGFGAAAKAEEVIRGRRRRDSVHAPGTVDPARERAMLVVGMRLDGKREARPAVAEKRGELAAECVRDLVVGGERVPEVRDAKRAARCLRPLCVESGHEAVEGLGIVERRRRNRVRRIGIGGRRYTDHSCHEQNSRGHRLHLIETHTAMRDDRGVSWSDRRIIGRHASPHPCLGTRS